MTQDVDLPPGDTVTAVPPGGRRVRTRDDGGPPLTWRQRLSRWDVRLSPYLYVSPFFVLFLIVGMFPLVYTAYVSVFEWGLRNPIGEMAEQATRLLLEQIDAEGRMRAMRVIFPPSLVRRASA